MLLCCYVARKLCVFLLFPYFFCENGAKEVFGTV